jgi:hypothetical protein
LSDGLQIRPGIREGVGKRGDIKVMLVANDPQLAVEAHSAAALIGFSTSSGPLSSSSILDSAKS